LLFVVAAVVDVGNWYVHGKRLQTLVDAGALAGGPKFVGCSLQVDDKSAANTAIRAAALEYAGDFTRYPGTRNFQVQNAPNVHVVLNSAGHWQDNDPVQGEGLDDTINLDGDNNPNTPADPCSVSSLDVKATEDDAPLLFGFIWNIIDPKRNARVQVEPVVQQNGMLPWAVPEDDPAAVAAIFVREDTGGLTPRFPQLLEKQDLSTTPFAEWRTKPDEEAVHVDSPNTGIVILVSKTDDTPTLMGSLYDICNQAPGFVRCYGGHEALDGIGFIHGWASGPATPGSPRIGDVTLSNTDCPEELSAPYFYRSGGCQVGVTAVIDFGVDDPDDVNAEVELDAPGCGGSGCAMEYQGPGPSGTQGIWETTEDATFDPTFEGRAEFSIDWQTSGGGGKKKDDDDDDDDDGGGGSGKSGTFEGVAHPYVADEGSGPIEYLDLDSSDGVPDPSSRQQSPPSRSVIVTVGFRQPFQLESPLAPPEVLRVASPSGSQNQAYDCDENINSVDEIADGCVTSYKENYGDFDDDGVNEWQDILCSAYPNGAGLPPELPQDPAVTPPNCVRIEPGDKIGQFRQGVEARFETPCVPNNWPESEDEYDDFVLNYDFANDPRYVILVITDYSAFQDSGSSEAVPVKHFAGFYATGWDIEGSGPKCLDNEPHPWYGGSYKKSLDNGDVWGHFVNITVSSALGQGNGKPCDFDEVGTCIVQLVE
jgi:hypothetical protein